MKLDNIIVASIFENDEYTRKVQENLHVCDGKSEDQFVPAVFSGSEFNPHMHDGTDVKGKNIYLFATNTGDTSSLCWKVVHAAETFKYLGAGRIYGVLTNLPFARQDRGSFEDQKMKGQANSAEILAGHLKLAGIEGIITMDVHSQRVIDTYSRVFGHSAVFNLNPYNLLAHFIVSQSGFDLSSGGEKLVFCAPDAGAEKKVQGLLDLFSMLGYPNVSAIFMNKSRRSPNNPDELIVSFKRFSDNYNGYDGKIIIFVDDIADTCGTLLHTGRYFLNSGKERAKEMVIYFTHPVLEGDNFTPPQKRLALIGATEIITTNTHPAISDRRIWLLKKNSTVLRTAAYFADTIREIECYSQLMEESGNSVPSVSKLVDHIDQYYEVRTPDEFQRFGALYSIKQSELHERCRK